MRQSWPHLIPTVSSFYGRPERQSHLSKVTLLASAWSDACALGEGPMALFWGSLPLFYLDSPPSSRVLSLHPAPAVQKCPATLSTLKHPVEQDQVHLPQPVGQGLPCCLVRHPGSSPPSAEKPTLPVPDPTQLRPHLEGQPQSLLPFLSHQIAATVESDPIPNPCWTFPALFLSTWSGNRAEWSGTWALEPDGRAPTPGSSCSWAAWDKLHHLSVPPT